MQTAHPPALERVGTRTDMLAEALRLGTERQWNVASMKLAVGGNSRESWIADLHDGAETRKAVLRCDPDHWIRPEEMRREIDGLRLAEQVGVPAPRIIVSSDDVALDRPYVVIDFVEGTAIARHVLRDAGYAQARRLFARQCGEILGRLHGAAEHAQHWCTRDPLTDIGAHLENVGYPSPALEGGLAWLEQHQPPPPSQLVPVHSDFRIGNLMMQPSGIAGVLDWETCHLCDPYEDLGWLTSRAWRYGGDQPVGGIGPLAELLGAYADTTGLPIDHDRLHWWSVYGLVSWGLVCNRVRGPGTPGDVMEGAAVGRQVCQQEYHVLLELERHVRR